MERKTNLKAIVPVVFDGDYTLYESDYMPYGMDYHLFMIDKQTEELADAMRGEWEAMQGKGGLQIYG